MRVGTRGLTRRNGRGDGGDSATLCVRPGRVTLSIDGWDAVLGLGLVLTLGRSRSRCGVTASRRRSSSVFPGHLSWTSRVYPIPATFPSPPSLARHSSQKCRPSPAPSLALHPGRSVLPLPFRRGPTSPPALRIPFWVSIPADVWTGLPVPVILGCSSSSAEDRPLHSAHSHRHA